MSFKYEVIEPKLFAGAAADEILHTVEDVLAERPRCSIALAGGGTPIAVYKALSVPPRSEDVRWSSLDLFLGDERWVSHSDPQSNFRMAQENLLSQLHGEKPKIFPVDTSLSSSEQGAAQYERSIQDALDSVFPEIDLVLLGMGDDGHTASIFPGSKLMTQSITNQSLIATEPFPKQPSQMRVTMTPKLLLNAKKIIFLVQGNGKAEMIKRAFDEKETASLPVHLFRLAREKVTWLLDSEAARYISQ